MSDNKLPEQAQPSPKQQDRVQEVEKLIREQAPEILNAIPVQDRPKLAQIISETRISYRSGILPEPSELAAYDAIIPNGADRIMKMAESQSAHRIGIETTVVESQQCQEKRGQIFGLIIAIFFGACGLYAAIQGHPVYGGAVSGTTLVSLVGVFVYSKSQSKKQLAIKRESSMNEKPGSPAKPDKRK